MRWVREFGDRSELRALLRQCACRRPWDEQAWSRFMRSYGDDIYCLAEGMLGDSVEAQDVTVQVFERIARAGLRTSDPLRATLGIVKTTCNLCIDVLRKRKTARRAAESVEEVVPLREEALDIEAVAVHRTANAGLRGTLMAGLNRMSPKRRTVVLLCLVLGFSPAQAAEALGMTQSGVRRLLCEARKQLREWLGPGPLNGGEG